jgi:predicted nuclease with TOPRIM domain
MSTNKELEAQVKQMGERVSKLQSSNSKLKDEILIMQNNYSRLVEQMNARLEAVHDRFQAKS